MELAGQVAAADQPDVLASGRPLHGGVHRPHVAADEVDGRGGYAGSVRLLNTHVGCV